MKALAIIAVLAIGFVAFTMFSKRSASASKANDLPTISDFINQTETDIPSRQATVGLTGFSENRATTPENAKNNIISANLFSEDSLRKLASGEFVNQQVTTGSGQTQQTKTVPKPLVLFRSADKELKVLDQFNAINDQVVENPISKNKVPLSKGFVGRKQRTYLIQTTDLKTGTTKQRIGSSGLVKRLQQNFARG